MKRKKTPILGIILLIFLLAALCIGGVTLATASIADPELYASITNPVKKYVVDQLYELGLQIEGAKASMANQLVKFSNNMAQKKEAFLLYLNPPKPEVEEEAPDPQALSDSDLLAPNNAADYSTTHFVTDARSGQEYLTGGSRELVYFNQTDPEWGEYGSDSISGYGCGPTSMAMVVSTLTRIHVDPQEMSNIFVREGYWALGSGTYYNFAEGSGGLFGLNVESVSPEEITSRDLLQYLMAGNLAIALVSKGHFTNGGHFIVLHGSTLSGDVLVADPASRERSLIAWDPQLILDELSSVRLNGAPLWFFSPLGSGISS